MIKNRKLRRMLFLSALIPAAFICVASFSGCSSKNDDASSGGDAGDSDVSSSAQEGTETPKVEITMEDGGTITLELDRDNAPKTVENFLKLINDKFYDGLTFHRIIPNFMIQGGDPEGTGMGGSDEEIVGEFSSNGFSNSLSHTRGVISMARSQNMDSASSQFFITNADAPNLDGDYAAFGRVTDGMDVVDKISAVKTGANDRPVEPVVIKSIRVID